MPARHSDYKMANQVIDSSNRESLVGFTVPVGCEGKVHVDYTFSHEDAIGSYELPRMFLLKVVIALLILMTGIQLLV